LVECANTCSQCADACLSEQDVTKLAKCIRLDLDCADICLTASRSLSRQTEYDANLIRPLLEACAAACKSCGHECMVHSEHMDHCGICAEACQRCAQACQRCAQACQRCAQACRQLLSAIS
jgi:hypothetical protein